SRRAELAANAEQRDAALLFALRAAGVEKNGRAARSLVAELVADDYRGLERTVRLSEQPAYWSFDWSRTVLLTIDAQRRIAQRPLAGASADPAPVPITALEHSPVTREILVGED